MTVRPGRAVILPAIFHNLQRKASQMVNPNKQMGSVKEILSSNYR